MSGDRRQTALCFTSPPEILPIRSTTAIIISDSEDDNDDIFEEALEVPEILQMEEFTLTQTRMQGDVQVIPSGCTFEPSAFSRSIKPSDTASHGTLGAEGDAKIMSRVCVPVLSACFVDWNRAIVSVFPQAQASFGMQLKTYHRSAQWSKTVSGRLSLSKVPISIYIYIRQT